MLNGTVRKNRKSLFNVTGVDEFAFLTGKTVTNPSIESTSLSFTGNNNNNGSAGDEKGSVSSDELSVSIRSNINRSVGSVESILDRVWC